MTNNNDLVTVTVISYNSAKTIIETLESIKAQTYSNIELIISDDCSQDDSVVICKKWIELNRSRFFGVRLFTAEKNQGVCANGNKAKFAARGKWIKGIAADDILLPNCIKDYLDFVSSHPDAKFMSAFRRIYSETFEEKNFISEDKVLGDNSIYEKSIQDQLKVGSCRLLAQGPVMFFATEIFHAVGGYHPEYPFEDYPFQIDALEKGYKLYLVPKATVGYRVHQSVCHVDGKLFNAEYKRRVRPFFEKRCFKYLTKKQQLGQRLIWTFEEFLIVHNLYKKNVITQFMYKYIIIVIRRIFNLL